MAGKVATSSSAYNAGKAALNVLTTNLRMDMRVAYPGIHVSLVMPGNVATDFAQHTLWGSPVSAGKFNAADAEPQIQSPEQVATAIASLIAEPKPGLDTNPRLGDIARLYYQDVGRFEDNLISPPAHAERQ